MICRLTLQPNVDTPVHSHPHEQMTIVERGARVSSSGDARIAVAGDVLHFPRTSGTARRCSTRKSS